MDAWLPPVVRATCVMPVRGYIILNIFCLEDTDVKTNTHPETMAAKVVCACGETFETLSIKDKIHVDICSACHPFFTGKQKIVDAEGRVEKFKKKYAKKEK